MRKLFSGALAYARVVGVALRVIIRWSAYVVGGLFVAAILGVCLVGSGASPMYGGWSTGALVVLAIAVFLGICLGGPALYRYAQAKARVNIGKRLIGRHL